MITTSTLIADIKDDLLPPPVPPPIPKTMQDHANAVGEAYDKFCKALTTSYGGSLVSTGKSQFISTFMSTINIPVPTLSNYGLALELGAIAYWLNSVFPLLTGLPPGFGTQLTITQTVPVGVQVGTLALSVPGGTADTVATIVGTALSVGTLTGVLTTHTGLTPPLPVPAPITAGPSPLI